MLRGLIRKSIFLGSAFVAMFFLCSGEGFSQSLEQEATVEENIPTEDGLTVKYVNGLQKRSGTHQEIPT